MDDIHHHFHDFNQFSFDSDPSRIYSCGDSHAEEIAPDSNVISTQDLVNLASQFGQTNLRPSSQRSNTYPEPLISIPMRPPIPTRTSSKPLSAQLAERRQKSRHDSRNDRRAARQSLARLQSRLEKIAEFEKVLNDTPEYTPESQGISISGPESEHHTSTPNAGTSTASPEPMLDIASLAGYRRTADLKPRTGYIRKQIRLRKHRTANHAHRASLSNIQKA